MNKKILIVIIVVVAILAVLFSLRFIVGGPEDDWICSGGEWIKHGNPAAPMPTESCGEKYIACTMEAKLCSDGSYVGRSGPKCEFAPCPKEDLIQIESPRAGEAISSPLLIRGEARGQWFFEASFPVKLVDENGKVLAQMPAQAKSEWMTTDFVPFEVKLIFSTSTAQKGYLIFKKDNPSGLPEHDDELRVPIVFSR